MKVTVLAADTDELGCVVDEKGDVSAADGEIPNIDEDIVTIKGNELDDLEITDSEDEAEIAEGTSEAADVGVEDVVGVEVVVEDEMDEEVKVDGVAASDDCAATELGLEVEDDVGRVEEDGAIEFVCSICVEENAFPASTWVEVVLDVVGTDDEYDSMEDASAVEVVNNHVGVTGMTVNPPSSALSSPLFLRRAAGVPDTVREVNDTVLVTSGRVDDAAS